ncbi:hypothetical protein [Nocardia macrotermitis]|uniref:Uncharacterized protein n=1 Tax=Nocardia macrotermitis TaxID=2585198 RepID=A0A7K0DEH1_9NOCA|nr:hypothetical protein [Nocardia macrotermitis]MQY23682.1 hypothetical protein [Nocardia macrotermitis]
MSEHRSSTSDSSADRELVTEAQRHRELLRGPIEDYRRRLVAQARYLQPMQRSPMLTKAEEHIADLMIDPVRHRDLDLEVYRAVRDGLPTRWDARYQRFIAQSGSREIPIWPHSAERRLGIIARLAARNVDVEQILTVSMVVIAHPAGPDAAVVPPVRATRRAEALTTTPQPTGTHG